MGCDDDNIGIGSMMFIMGLTDKTQEFGYSSFFKKFYIFLFKLAPACITAKKVIFTVELLPDSLSVYFFAAKGTGQG